MEMNYNDVEKVLGRKQHKELLNIENVDNLVGKKILITGANGSIGTVLCKRLDQLGISYLATDIEGNLEYLDITDFHQVFSIVNKYQPDFIVNIAGAKHAPDGEHETWKTLSINTIGTKNLIDCAPMECSIILTSTCKSCNPEIVYGSSKLIAERMIMNSGGSVARFFNVVESSGNVFEIWDQVPESLPIKVAPTCERHFISVGEATGLILYAMNENKNKRYIVNSGHLRLMKDVAEDLYPQREKIIIEPRRGDRLTERFMSTSESIKKYHLNNSIIELKSIHDKI
jgi:FlaA1/EpsC-like NDP-sugar epimerase